MKRKTKIWISFIFVFLLGAALGITGTSYYVKSHIRDFVEGGPPRANRRIIMQVVRDMDLTESQREEIDQIISDYRPEIEALSREFGVSIREITDRQFKEVKEELTPEQRKILEQRVAELKEHFKRVFDRKGEKNWDRGHFHPRDRRDLPHPHH